MQANISNIIDGLILKIKQNADSINQIIHRYQDNKQLQIFKGLRDNLGASSYPCLQLQPSSGNHQWSTTDSQNSQYSVDMYLTVSTTALQISVQYIGSVVQSIVQIFNMPYNMHFIIPNQIAYNPITKKYTPMAIHFGNISSVTYASNKVGSLRVAQFTWTGNVKQAYPRQYWNFKKLDDLGFLPRPEIPDVLNED